MKRKWFCVTKTVLVSSSLPTSNKKLTNAGFKVVSFKVMRIKSTYLTQEKGLKQLD